MLSVVVVAAAEDEDGGLSGRTAAIVSRLSPVFFSSVVPRVAGITRNSGSSALHRILPSVLANRGEEPTKPFH